MFSDSGMIYLISISVFCTVGTIIVYYVVYTMSFSRFHEFIIIVGCSTIYGSWPPLPISSRTVFTSQYASNFLIFSCFISSHLILGLPWLFLPLGRFHESAYIIILSSLSVIKRWEECNTYLTHVCRHDSSGESPVKRWKYKELSSVLAESSLYFHLFTSLSPLLWCLQMWVR